MNSKEFKLLKDGGVVKVGKNQIFFDENSYDNPLFVVERWEYNASDDTPMYSSVDGFEEFDKAVIAAKNPSRYFASISMS